MAIFYYVDTCIWLNLFKKEGDATKGKPYWEIANDFIENVKNSTTEEILYSCFILKELKFKLSSIFFEQKLLFFKKECKRVHPTRQDYSFARKLESKLEYELSFFDCLHIAMSKRLNFILITRDKTLIKFARKYVLVKKPEELLS